MFDRLTSRRGFLISAGSAAGLGLLAACAPTPTPAPEQKPAAPAQVAPATTGGVTITVMGSPTNITDTTTKLFGIVEQKNNIKVNYVESPQVSQTYHDKLVTMFAAKDASVDIFNCNGTVWPTGIRRGWLDDAAGSALHRRRHAGSHARPTARHSATRTSCTASPTCTTSACCTTARICSMPKGSNRRSRGTSWSARPKRWAPTTIWSATPRPGVRANRWCAAWSSTSTATAA